MSKYGDACPKAPARIRNPRLIADLKRVRPWCQSCGRRFPRYARSEFDVPHAAHIGNKPRHDTFDNVAIICARCHLGDGHVSGEDLASIKRSDESTRATAYGALEVAAFGSTRWARPLRPIAGELKALETEIRAAKAKEEPHDSS